ELRLGGRRRAVAGRVLGVELLAVLAPFGWLVDILQVRERRRRDQESDRHGERHAREPHQHPEALGYESTLLCLEVENQESQQAGQRREDRHDGIEARGEAVLALELDLVKSTVELEIHSGACVMVVVGPAASLRRARRVFQSQPRRKAARRSNLY